MPRMHDLPRKTSVWISAVLLTMSTIAAFAAHAADAQRQAEVARQGADVMPFDVKATIHIFTKTGDGGVQRVIAKDASDERQVRLTRAHLRVIQSEFLRGDLSGPSRVHGNDMPGLAQLKAAKPDQISVAYQDVVGGGELALRSVDAKLVAALHAWFDAQLSDHGVDAVAGHHHQHADSQK